MGIADEHARTTFGTGLDAIFRYLETREWRLALALSSHFVVAGTLVVDSPGLHELALDKLTQAGWRIVSHSSRNHLSLLTIREPEPVPATPRTRSTMTLTRVVEKYFTVASLQPLQDEISFMMATLGIEVDFCDLHRIRPTEPRPPRWGLVRGSGVPRSKALVALQAEHVTVGDRFKSERSWDTLGIDQKSLQVHFGPNDLAARSQDEAASIRSARNLRRRDHQAKAALAVAAIVAAAGLVLPLPTSFEATSPSLIGIVAAVVAGALIAGGGTWWLAKKAFRPPTVNTVRSWAMWGIVIGTTLPCAFLLLVALREWLPVPLGALIGGLLVAAVLGATGTIVLYAAVRVRRLHARQTPWLVLATSFGIVVLVALLNVPSVLFLWGADDLSLVGSVPVGIAFASGAPIVAALVVLVLTPKAIRSAGARAPYLLVLPVIAGTIALAIGVGTGTIAWQGGRALVQGRASDSLVLSMETSVCATIGDESAAPFWLLGTQGAAVHLVPRAVPGSDAPAGGLVLASADTRFVSVDADDDCS